MRERDKPAYPVTMLAAPLNGLTKYERTVERMAAAMIAGLWSDPDAGDMSDAKLAELAKEKATAIWDAIEAEGETTP